MKEKDAAAQALVRKRWAKTSAKERYEYAMMMVRARQEKARLRAEATERLVTEPSAG